MARIFLRIGFPFSIVFDEFWIGSFCRVASRGKIIFKIIILEKTFDSNIGISMMFGEKGFRDY